MKTSLMVEQLIAAIREDRTEPSNYAALSDLLNEADKGDLSQFVWRWLPSRCPSKLKGWYTRFSLSEWAEGKVSETGESLTEGQYYRIDPDDLPTEFSSHLHNILSPPEKDEIEQVTWYYFKDKELAFEALYESLARLCEE